MEIENGLKKCGLDDLCFPVKLIENPNNCNTEHSKIVCGIIGNDPYHLNYCSSRYELVPNQEIFPVIEDILNKNGIEFESHYTHTKYSRFYAKYVITDPRFAYIMNGTNDVIRFVWNFQHSYNGLTKYRGTAGFYRQICTNGLMVPIKAMNKYNLCIQGKHTSSILGSLQSFKNILLTLIEDINVIKNDIGKNYEILGGRWVANVEDRVKEVLNTMNIVKSFDDIDLSIMSAKDRGIYAKQIEVNNEKVNSILAVINNEANNKNLGYNGKVNDWLIYNGINNYIHDDNRNVVAPEKRMETDGKVLEYLLSV